MFSRSGAFVIRGSRKFFLFQQPLRRTFCDAPKSVYEELISHPSDVSKIMLSSSLLGFGGFVLFGLSCSPSYRPTKKDKQLSPHRYAWKVRWRMMSAHGHILCGMALSGISLLTMFRFGYAARLAKWPNLSFCVSTFTAVGFLLVIQQIPYCAEKQAFFVLTSCIIGITGAAMINRGVSMFGDEFLRMVLIAGIIFGHCATIAAVAPNECWLEKCIWVGAGFGAITAASISCIFLPHLPFYKNIALLIVFGLFGAKTLGNHASMVLKSHEICDECDPINEGFGLLIKTITDFIKYVKRLTGNEDKD